MPSQKDNVDSEVPEMDHMDEAAAEVEQDALEAIELSEEALVLVQRLEQERDEAVGARQRALADFRNFQRRSMENEIRAAQDGTANVIRSLLPVLDHFELALNQDIQQLSVEQLEAGVKLVRDELNKALACHGVISIIPAIGDEFDPNLHQAMMRQVAEGVAPNHIVLVLQTGYMIGEQILRPAKVAVAPADDDSDDDPAAGDFDADQE